MTLKPILLAALVLWVCGSTIAIYGSAGTSLMEVLTHGAPVILRMHDSDCGSIEDRLELGRTSLVTTFRLIINM